MTPLKPSAPLSSKVLDGNALAKTLCKQVAQRVTELTARAGKTPCLKVIQVGGNPASSVYVKKKAEKAHQLGIASEVIRLKDSTEQAELEALLEQLNQDPGVHAILLQLPLPSHLDANRCQLLTRPEKDVDGFHPLNMGKLVVGQKPYAVACTPAGILWMLEQSHIPLVGKHAVIIGRSSIVGKPMAQLLLNKNCTVTLCHSKTQHLPELCAQADILVAAIGKPQMVTPNFVKPGAIVIDVGINRLADGRLVGDVHYEPVAEKASLITPVPGGVGPMTIAMLMSNTVDLFEAAMAAPQA